MDNPILFSILITAYNRQNFIADAIESVIRSPSDQIEIIIVDDGSKDNTPSIISGYAGKDSRIRFYRNEKNLGDYQNRNKAASYAKGEYLMYVDSDDMLKEDTLSNLSDVIRQYPSLPFASYTPLEVQQPVYFDPISAIRTHFFKTPLLMHGPVAMLIKRSFFEQIGGFPEKYGPANDRYFNLKAASVGGILALPFDFVSYRRHEGQEINNSYSYLYNNYLVLHDALDELSLSLSDEEKAYLTKKNKRRFAVNCIRYYIKTGRATSVYLAAKKAGYGFSDFLTGIFHYYPTKPVA